VEGEDGGGGVGFVVESWVGGEVGGVGLGGVGAIQWRIEEAVFDSGEVLELPDDQGEFLDEDGLSGGGGAVFFTEFLLEGGEGESGGGVGDGDCGWREGGGKSVGSGVLGGAGFAFFGAGAGGFLGVLFVSGGAGGCEVVVG